MSALITTTNSHTEVTSSAAITTAIDMWARATTRDGDRLEDLLRDKARIVSHFFAFVGKSPQFVTPQDVAAWLDELREHGTTGEPFSASGVYAAASRVSSFYRWLLKDDALRGMVAHNPVELARPPAPKAYENSQALSDDEVDALLEVVRTKANAGDLPALRDFAMLMFYLTTAHRREEVNRLKWKNVKRNGVLQVEFTVKGGDRQWEVVEPVCYLALEAYLRATGRLDDMTPDAPLWTAHDRSGRTTGAPLSSHSFSKNLKAYASAAGLGAIHVHQLRHTAARIAGDESGDMGAVQNMLGHKNQQTTKIYLPRITTKKNPLGAAIVRRLGLNGEK